MTTGSTRVGIVIENKYRLDDQIGHGGMGAVYLGTQLMVDRKVAVKLLHPTFSQHESIQARFEVEAKAIGRLNHPNCITLFDFGYSDDLAAFYTVVEFINGESLDTLIPKKTPLQDVVAIVRQIASALDHAHHHGILHRDLKPENIMLAKMTDGSEMVKVLDFGIAQIMKGDTNQDRGDEFEADRITRVGEVFGTPPYMSPEQARSTRNLKPTCDLYSLGIIFYELVEGRLPFYSDAPLDILLMHLNEPPPPLKRKNVPQDLQDVIFGLLEKEPEKRPASGKELIAQLDALSQDLLAEPSAADRSSHQLRRSPPGLADNGIERAETLAAIDELEIEDRNGVHATMPTQLGMEPDLDDVIVSDIRQKRLGLFIAAGVSVVLLVGSVIWFVSTMSSDPGNDSQVNEPQAQVLPDDLPAIDAPKPDTEIAIAATNDSEEPVEAEDEEDPKTQPTAVDNPVETVDTQQLPPTRPQPQVQKTKTKTKTTTSSKVRPAGDEAKSNRPVKLELDLFDENVATEPRPTKLEL